MRQIWGTQKSKRKQCFWLSNSVAHVGKRDYDKKSRVALGRAGDV